MNEADLKAKDDALEFINKIRVALDREPVANLEKSVQGSCYECLIAMPLRDLDVFVGPDAIKIPSRHVDNDRLNKLTDIVGRSDSGYDDYWFELPERIQEIITEFDNSAILSEYVWVGEY